MSECNFTIPFEGPADKLVIKARFAVESQGGNFTGDTSSGNFEVSVFGSSITGSYTVDQQNFNIIITDKPCLIPCSAIEAFLKNQLSK